MSNKNNKLHNFINILFIGIIFLILFTGLIATVFMSDDINTYENRYANKINTPTLNSYLDNSFQTNVEDALSDQIPLAQSMKKSYNQMVSLVSEKMLLPIINNADNKYISYKNGIGIFNGYYVYYPSQLEYLKSAVDNKIENYNSLFKKYPEIDFYVYYVEKDTDINFETGEKLNLDSYLFSHLDLADDNKASYKINSFDDFSTYFYKTDHHWKHIGSYKAYREIIDLLNSEGEPLQKGEELKISDKFMGSKALVTGSSIIDEPFYVYNFDFPDFESIISTQIDDYGFQSDFILNNTQKEATYGNFYGGDEGELIFDSGKVNFDNILVIGESYDNAILKLLATHYNKTYSIDLRYYRHIKGKDFNFERYITDNDIDKVLFIGNIDFYISDVFNLGDN